MRINLKKQISLLSIIFFFSYNGFSQESVVIDRVVANVGDKIILQSDIENQVLQYVGQGYPAQSGIECQILEQLLTQKLLLIQAEYDTLQVSPNVVESELQQRLDYFIRQIGSEKKLEEYYHKSIIEIKDDFRPLIKEQLMTQSMQRSIVEGLQVSPKDVEAFYKKLPKDSIPLINTQYEIKQITIHPEQSEDAKNEAREKLLNIRERIVNGERFSTLAVLYSEDPSSARRGGELGFRTRDELDPEFAKAAFRLSDEAGVSRIVGGPAAITYLTLHQGFSPAGQQDRIGAYQVGTLNGIPIFKVPSNVIPDDELLTVWKNDTNEADVAVAFGTLVPFFSTGVLQRRDFYKEAGLAHYGDYQVLQPLYLGLVKIGNIRGLNMVGVTTGGQYL